MTLTAGTQLGPYKIASLLGAGGMGEVYRAHDCRLGREVAVKIVRHAMAESSTRRECFEREARVLAALSHPNIVTMHDVGCADGQIYAVMELLHGETLRARLARGPLPWRRAVAIAAAVAEGLGAAHTKGAVHRDLKPANVFLTADGRVKVLDFGLARLANSATSELSSSATVSQAGSGTISGTRGYMSPEQVSGGTIDSRTDLFALGAPRQWRQRVLRREHGDRVRGHLQECRSHASGEVDTGAAAGGRLHCALHEASFYCLPRRRTRSPVAPA